MTIDPDLEEELLEAESAEARACVSDIEEPPGIGRSGSGKKETAAS